MDIDIGLVFAMLNPADKRVMLNILNKAYNNIPKDDSGRCIGFRARETEETIAVLNAASKNWDEISKVDPEYLKAAESQCIEPQCIEPKCTQRNKKKTTAGIIRKTLRKIFATE
jgi:hypothetical protein